MAGGKWEDVSANTRGEEDKLISHDKHIPNS